MQRERAEMSLGEEGLHQMMGHVNCCIGELDVVATEFVKEVFSEDNNLLRAELDAAWIGAEHGTRDLVHQALSNGGRKRRARKNVTRARVS